MIGEIDVDGPKLTRLERSGSTLQRVKKAKNEEILGAVLAFGTIGMLVTISSSECPGIKNLKEFLYVAGAISMINGVWPALFKIKQTEAAGDKVATPIKAAATVLGLTSLAMGIAGLVFSLTNHEYFDGPHSLNDAAVEACEQVKACTLANGYDGCVNGTLPADYDGCELKFCAQDVFLAAFIMGCICGSIGVGVIACIVYIVVKGDQVGLQPS